MNVVSEKNEILNSSVSTQVIDGAFGLVMESRSGAKGKSNERNTDYFVALDTILGRMRAEDIDRIKVSVVSSGALKIWSARERLLEIDGNAEISLKGKDVRVIRGKISKAQQDKKENRSSKGGNAAKRILIDAPLDMASWKEVVRGKGLSSAPLSEGDIEDTEAQPGPFYPEGAEKEKDKVARLISSRRGQPKFRKALLKSYGSECAITRTTVIEILEAAHIVPYMGDRTNHITNGLLLRADIHTLFDLGLIGVNQSYQVVVSSRLSGTEYELLDGKTIKLPTKKSEQPSLTALASRPLPSRR